MAFSPDELIEHAKVTAEFLNMRYFDGALSFTVEFSKSRKKHVYASCWAKKKPPEITLMTCLLYASQDELDEIISHELIHVAQGILDLSTGHGQSFRDLAGRFGIPKELGGQRCSSRYVRYPLEMIAGRPLIERPKISEIERITRNSVNFSHEKGRR